MPGHVAVLYFSFPKNNDSDPGIHLAQSVDEVVLPKSIPTQICQLILYNSNSEGYVDGFVGELTYATSNTH